VEAKQIKELIEKYLSGTADPKERSEVEEWYEQIDTNPAEIDPSRIGEYKRDTHRFLSAYIENSGISHHHKKPAIYRWLAAAVLLLCIGGGIYFYKNDVPAPQVAATQPLKNDVSPGGNKAMLTLSNGKKIVLTDTENGVIATQSDIVIDKTADGKLAYHADNKADAGTTALYNTMSTPRGGNYFLILEDGTKVWLNAASSLKYPVAFKSAERLVELTGEAYFEVAKNKNRPFKVVSAEQTVEVLGTHFNINSYSNEVAIKTTLLEGSVKISAGENSAIIKPGEQSAYNPAASKPLTVSATINTNEVIAWKNGKFIFDEADIRTVLRQLERWYDVDVVFTGKIPTDHFRGTIPKNVNLSQVLKVLEQSGVNFKIEGKKIVIR